MLILFFSTLLIAVIFTKAVLQFGGLAADVPNERSSHSTITPRGGGVAIMASIFLALFFFTTESLPPSTTLCLIFAGAMGVMGVIEDVRPLPALTRLLAELAIALIVSSAGLSWLDLNTSTIVLQLPHWLAALLSALWLVWVVNLFNFMDGINGIAVFQALVVSVFLVFSAPALAPVGLVMTAALCGFLPFNFPRAKIFLGDSGSLFLGALVASAPIALSHQGMRFSIIQGMLLIMPFFLDASLTLLKRLIRGENILKAHRDHHYQMLATLYEGHSKSALLFFCWGIIFAGSLVEPTPSTPMVQTILTTALTLWFVLIQTRYGVRIRQDASSRENS